MPKFSLVFLSSFLAFLGSLSAQSTNTAIAPVSMNKPGWMERHESINAKARQGKIDLVYIGDSIVQRFDGAGKPVWEHYYTPRNALNLGISGDRTQHVIWRLDHGNIDGITPKLAIVMIGQNNGGHNSATEIAEGVTEVVKRIRTKLPNTKILLLGIFQRREKPTPERAVLAEANQIISNLADSTYVTYMDINSVYVQPDGTISASLMPDFEHPSELGFKRWAEAIESKVSYLMGDQPLLPMP